jgi:Telomeric repeat-binding factor 2.
MLFYGICALFAGLVILITRMSKRERMSPEEKEAIKNKFDTPIAAGIIMSLLGLILIGASFQPTDSNNQSINSTNNTPISQPLTSQPVQQPQPAQLAASGTSSNVLIEVLGMETLDSINREKAIGVFKVVNLKISNNQNDEITISSNSFKLIDDKGREFSYSSEGNLALSFADETTLSFKGLNPGLTIEGKIAFDVPKDATGLKLKARGGMTGADILLKVE